MNLKISLFGCGLRRISKELQNGGDPIPWIYLGNNYFKRKQAQALLGDKFQLVDTARILRRTAEATKQEYASWADQINRKYGTNIDWWFGAISSRNSYQSNIFLYICFMEVFKQLWAKEKGKPRVVIIDSEGLYRSFYRWAREQGITVEVYGQGMMMGKHASKVIYTFLRWGKFWFIRISRLIAATLSKVNSHYTNQINADILVGTIINDRSISSDGILNDRYFPGLYEFYEQKKQKVAVFAILDGFGYNYFSIFRRLRRSGTRFLIPEDVLSITDYWDTFKYSLKVLQRNIEATAFHGFDLFPILIEEQLYEDTVTGLEPHLVYCFFKRLKNKGINIKNAIVWYENRIIDKAVVAGLRQAFFDINIIGAQGFLHVPYLLSMSPTNTEVEARVTPHHFLATSEYECRLTRIFCPHIPCQGAAALRFQHLFANGDHGPKVQKTGMGPCILVLLPYSVAEAVEILEILYEVIPELDKNIRILIKPHPVFSLSLVKSIFGFKRWPQRFEDFYGKLQDGFGQADIAISSTSSSMVEAAACGLPVIFIGGKTSIEESLMFQINSDMAISCFSVPEVIKAIGRFSHLTMEEVHAFEQEGKGLRDLFFTPVNENTMKPFLGNII